MQLRRASALTPAQVWTAAQVQACRPQTRPYPGPPQGPAQMPPPPALHMHASSVGAICSAGCLFLLVFIPRRIQTVIGLTLCKSKTLYICGRVCACVDSEGGELSQTWSIIHLLDWSIYLICGPLAPTSQRSLLCLFFGKNKIWKKRKKKENTITINYNKTF